MAGDYLVVDLKAVVADIDGAYINVQGVKAVFFDATNLIVPLKQAYDDSRDTTSGLQRGHQAKIMDLFETDVVKTTKQRDVPPLDSDSGGNPRQKENKAVIHRNLHLPPRMVKRRFHR